MGRPRKPTSLKILDGDRPDRINRDEPAAPPGVGDPPTWLDRYGKDAWERVAGHHRATRILTVLDAEALALYCQSYSTYRHALASITRDMARPAATTLDDDEPAEPEKPHPMMRVVNESHRQMSRLLSKCGMTPSDRAGLHVQAPPEDDELLRFLARPEPAAPHAKPSKPKRR